jgi:F-type H+-transporting ATPase subunit delta
MERYREMKNIRIGTLITAAPQEDLQNRLESMVSADMGGTVNLSTKVDESLIGGFVLQVGDLRMDASVAGQFQRIRNALIENDNRII